MKNFFFLIIFSLLCLHVSSQDIHFSQFIHSPLNLNPSLTGQFPGDYRFVGNHRNQWSSVTVPYVTFSLAADMQLPQLKKYGNFAGGILLNQDKAGDSRFSTLSAQLSLAWTRQIDADSVHFLSLGILAGGVQRSISYSKLYFDEQWDGDAYNPSLGNGETFGRENFFYLDYAMGMVWQFRKGERQKINAGIGGFHLNRPQQSFFNPGTVDLHRRYVLHASAQWLIHPLADIIPSLLFEKQNSFHEFLAGASVKYYLKSKTGNASALLLGLHTRMADALIIYTGFHYQNLQAGLSYDINTSGLRPASNGRGGFELSVIYILRKFVPFDSKLRPCPVYL